MLTLENEEERKKFGIIDSRVIIKEDHETLLHVYISAVNTTHVQQVQRVILAIN